MENKRYLFLTCCAQRLSPDRTGYQMEKLFSASLFLFELNFSTKCEKNDIFPPMNECIVNSRVREEFRAQDFLTPRLHEDGQTTEGAGKL